MSSSATASRCSSRRGPASTRRVPDADFERAGATIVPLLPDAWRQPMVRKVKEPQPASSPTTRRTHLVTYIHLVAYPRSPRRDCRRNDRHRLRDGGEKADGSLPSGTHVPRLAVPARPPDGCALPRTSQRRSRRAPGWRARGAPGAGSSCRGGQRGVGTPPGSPPAWRPRCCSWTRNLDRLRWVDRSKRAAS